MLIDGQSVHIVTKKPKKNKQKTNFRYRVRTPDTLLILSPTQWSPLTGLDTGRSVNGARSLAFEAIAGVGET
jgi:hypothetical protein